MLRSGRGIVGHVIRTGEMVLAPDVTLDPHYVSGRAATRSEIAVPVVSNDQVIGALNLESDRLNAFFPADAELPQFFASATAISIEKSMLHQELLGKQKIQQQLQDVNRNLFKWGEARRFTTAIYGVLNPDGCFTYVNCGRNHPLLLRFDGACETLEKGGLPLGMSHDWECESGKVSLRCGDVLALYTDGVVEVADDHDVQFGVERLRRTLQHTSRQAAHEMIRSVTDAIREFAARDSYDDDFTLMILKRNLPSRP